MGRKPSNVYDYFTRLEPISGKTLIRYECKKCHKQYASNATRLAEHLKQTGCGPEFQSNQGPSGTSNESQKSVDNALELVPPADVHFTASPNTHPILNGLRKDMIAGILENDLSLDASVQRLAKLSTCAIADALAQLHIQGHLHDVKLLQGYENPLSVEVCGQACTVKVMPINGALVKKLSFNYIDTTDLGHVIVISAPECITTAVFGGLYATASKVRGVTGIVTDGLVRDVQEICTMGLPAFSRGTSVHGSRGATTVVDVGIPVVVSGCVVRNGDIIRGDINGVVVIPTERVNEVATLAEGMEEQDNEIAEAVRRGESLQRAFQRYRAEAI